LEIKLTLLIIAAFIIILGYLFTRIVTSVTVWEYETGLRYHRGRFTGFLKPGQYWIVKFLTRIVRVDTRPTYTVLVGQEALSSDGVGLKASVAVRYRVTDARAAVHGVQDYQQALYLTVQIALRGVIGGSSIEDLLAHRTDLDADLHQLCDKPVEELGLKLLSVGIRDITFPGDLKKVFAMEVRARKEGLAALERARGETAALRNLANAAKLMENNPTLLRLRMIQALGESSGNTVVVRLDGTEDAVAPLGKAAGPKPEKQEEER
jgi:regulator of protease activity HflC (stomatin/prohibitin superfamily)